MYHDLNHDAAMALVRVGGEADKLGNHYEALWRLKLLLELFVGTAEQLVLESFDRAQSCGVDAEVRRMRGGALVTEFHSVKRQCTDGIWKPARLAKQDGAPLLPIRDKIRQDPSNRIGIFVSTEPVEHLQGLTDAAVRSQSASHLNQRFLHGSQDDRIKLGSLFNDLVCWWSISEDECFNILRSLRFKTVLEPDLDEEIASTIEREVMRLDGSEVDVNAVAQILTEMMRLHLGQTITKQMVIEHVRHVQPGYCEKCLRNVPSAVDQLEAQNTRFVREAQPNLIRSRQIPRDDVNSIVGQLTSSHRQWVMLTGDAGMGKSCVLAQVVDALKARQIPCFAFRFDTASPIDSTTKLKELLEIRWTPVFLLDSIAQRQHSVLIIDQVDALSDVAGRRNSQQWNVLHQVLDQARACPGMSIVLACRSFDLKADADLRQLLKRTPERRDWPEAVTIEVRPLAHEWVKECLEAEGIDANSWSQSDIDVLATPLHLGLFLQCKSENRSPVTSLGSLYDRYLEKLRLEASQTSPPWDFAAALATVVECFDQHQRLTLDWRVIQSCDLRSQTAQLISCGVLSDHSAGDTRVVRFFHTTLLDHAIGRLFVETGKPLLQMLCEPGERQELSRREHCRQVLSVLRKRSSRDHARYLAELSSLLTSPQIRVHLRLYLIQWLNALTDPSFEEWELIQQAAKCPPLAVTKTEHQREWQMLVLRLGIWHSVPWFDLLQSQGLWLKWLESGDTASFPQPAWMLGQDAIMKYRGDVIVAMLRSNPGADSNQRRRSVIAIICGGRLNTSENTASLFADAFTLDWPGLGDAGMWQHYLKDLVRVSKESSLRVLQCIFCERLRVKRSSRHPIRLAYEPRLLNWRQRLKERWDDWAEARKWDFLLSKPVNWRDRTWRWIKQVVKRSKLKFSAQRKPETSIYIQLKGVALLRHRLALWLFPPVDPHRIDTHSLVEFLSSCAKHLSVDYCDCVVAFIERMKKEHGEVAQVAITHLWMTSGGQLHEIGEAVIHSLHTSLTRLAETEPHAIDPFIERLLALEVPGLDHLVMQIWAACPQHSFTRVAPFFKLDPFRLFAQPSMWSGGNALSFYARTLLTSTAPLLSDGDFSDIERLILETEDPKLKSKAVRERLDESASQLINDPAKRKQYFRHLTWRNSGRHLLLSVLPYNRLSAAGRKKLIVWEDQYGKPDLSPPSAPIAHFIGAPAKLSNETLAKMTDAQVVEVMRSYPSTRAPDEPLDWCQSALVGQIGKLAASQKRRFLALMRVWPRDIDTCYQHTIIEGLLGQEHEGFQSADNNYLTEAEITELVTSLAPRSVPTVAKSICWSLGRKLTPYPRAWATTLIDLALHHSDPVVPGDDESIQIRAGGERIKGDELTNNGLNHVRGAACYALATALFADQSIAAQLRVHIPALLSDPSDGVRAAMIDLLIAWLNVNRDEAVGWFTRIVSGRDVLFHCHVAEHFFGYACHTHLDQLGPLIDHMAYRLNGKARDFGIHQTIRAAFISKDWVSKAEKLLKHRDSAVRLASIDTMLDHWAVPRHRNIAESWIVRGFSDTNETVQKRAANVFRRVPIEGWMSCGPLVRAFTDSPALLNASQDLLWRIDDAKPVPVDLIIHVLTRLVFASKQQVLTSRRSDKFHSVTHDAPKLVLLAYHNTTTDSQRAQCLDILDEMLVEGFYGIKELVENSSERPT